MKKFLLLPILLAVGFGLLMLLDSRSPNVAQKGDNGSFLKPPDAGLEIKDDVVGEGEEAKLGDSVTVHYTGRLRSGAKFDSSLDKNQPFTFRLGAGRVIRGWDEGVQGMKVGGKRQLIIPPHLGYGDRGSPPAIPGGATLVFDIELLRVNN